MSTKFSPTAVWRLARAGLAEGYLLPEQNVGTAGLVKTDGMGHGVAPSGEVNDRENVAVALGLDDNVVVIDVHREGLGDIGPLFESLGQHFAAFDHDRIGTDLDRLRIEIRLPAGSAAETEPRAKAAGAPVRT